MNMTSENGRGKTGKTSDRPAPRGKVKIVEALISLLEEKEFNVLRIGYKNGSSKSKHLRFYARDPVGDIRIPPQIHISIGSIQRNTIDDQSPTRVHKDERIQIRKRS